VETPDLSKEGSEIALGRDHQSQLNGPYFLSTIEDWNLENWAREFWMMCVGYRLSITAYKITHIVTRVLGQTL